MEEEVHRRTRTERTIELAGTAMTVSLIQGPSTVNIYASDFSIQLLDRLDQLPTIISIGQFKH
jgi:hypothetical protein